MNLPIDTGEGELLNVQPDHIHIVMSIPVKTPTQIPDGYPKSKDSSQRVIMHAIRLFISIHSSNMEAYVVSRKISIYSAFPLSLMLKQFDSINTWHFEIGDYDICTRINTTICIFTNRAKNNLIKGLYLKTHQRKIIIENI